MAEGVQHMNGRKLSLKDAKDRSVSCLSSMGSGATSPFLLHFAGKGVMCGYFPSTFASCGGKVRGDTESLGLGWGRLTGLVVRKLREAQPKGCPHSFLQPVWGDGRTETVRLGKADTNPVERKALRLLPRDADKGEMGFIERLPHVRSPLYRSTVA